MTPEEEFNMARNDYLQDPFSRPREEALKSITDIYAGQLSVADRPKLLHLYRTVRGKIYSEDLTERSSAVLQFRAIRPHLEIRDGGEDLILV